jgi:hypothetical protein
MALSKAQLRNKVLRFLSMLPEGQTADAHTATVTEDVIDQTHLILETKGIAYWATSAIPDGVAPALASFVASYLALELMEPERAGPYVSMRSSALDDLYAFTATENGAVRHTYF